MFGKFLATLFVGLLPLSAVELKIAVLHPLLGDLARQVGGDHVEIIDLIGTNADPHHFEPKPEDLKKAHGASLYLVAGMGLEGYLPKLKAIIANHATLIEVGASLPPLEGKSADDDGHVHDSTCAHGIDPHWWHSIDRFRRAAGVVAEALAAAAPENAVGFRKNAEAYRSQLDELEKWTRRIGFGSAGACFAAFAIALGAGFGSSSSTGLSDGLAAAGAIKGEGFSDWNPISTM